MYIIGEANNLNTRLLAGQEEEDDDDSDAINGSFPKEKTFPIPNQKGVIKDDVIFVFFKNTLRQRDNIIGRLTHKIKSHSFGSWSIGYGMDGEPGEKWWRAAEND